MEKENPYIRAIFGNSHEQKMVETLMTVAEKVVGTELIDGTGQTNIFCWVWHKTPENKKKWNDLWERKHKDRIEKFIIGLQIYYGKRINRDDGEDITVTFMDLPLAV